MTKIGILALIMEVDLKQYKRILDKKLDAKL